MTVDEVSLKLDKAEIGFARVSDPDILGRHPQLRRITIGTPSGPVQYPAPPARTDGEPRDYGPVPGIGEHSARVRAEFAPRPRKKQARHKPAHVALH